MWLTEKQSSQTDSVTRFFPLFYDLEKLICVFAYLHVPRAPHCDRAEVNWALSWTVSHLGFLRIRKILHICNHLQIRISGSDESWFLWTSDVSALHGPVLKSSVHCMCIVRSPMCLLYFTLLFILQLDSFDD